MTLAQWSRDIFGSGKTERPKHKPRISPADRAEIVRSYKQNPINEQVTILSELFAMKQCEIKSVLRGAGIDFDNVKGRQKKKEQKETESIRLGAWKEVREQLEFNRHRRKQLEFICLVNPKRQAEVLTEMQILAHLIDIQNLGEVTI